MTNQESKKTLGQFKGIVEGSETMWKVSFLVGDKIWNFKVFKAFQKKDGTAPKGLKPTDLKMDNWYTIFFREYQTPEMTYPSKTASNFFESKPLPSMKADSNQQTTMPNLALNQETPKVITTGKDTITIINEMNYFQAFILGYFQQVPKEKISVNHMFGTIVGSYFYEQFKPVFKQCQIAYDGFNKA